MANQIHRCGRCGEDWPAMPEFKECPGCDTPCEVVATEDHTPNVEGARKRASYKRFDRYLAKRFDTVIDEAGFQDWERKAIAEAEEALKQVTP